MQTGGAERRRIAGNILAAIEAGRWDDLDFELVRAVALGDRGEERTELLAAIAHHMLHGRPHRRCCEAHLELLRHLASG